MTADILRMIDPARRYASDGYQNAKDIVREMAIHHEYRAAIRALSDKAIAEKYNTTPATIRGVKQGAQSHVLTSTQHRGIAAALARRADLEAQHERYQPENIARRYRTTRKNVYAIYKRYVESKADRSEGMDASQRDQETEATA